MIKQHPDTEKYPDTSVTIPDEWVGAHLKRWQDADHKLDGEDLGEFAHFAQRIISLFVLADAWTGIKGMEYGASPKTWDFAQTPIPIMMWLAEVATETVDSYLNAFLVKKKTD